MNTFKFGILPTGELGMISLRLSGACCLFIAYSTLLGCDSEYSQSLRSLEGKSLLVVQLERTKPDGEPTAHQTAHSAKACQDFKSQMDYVKGMKGLDASWVLPATVIDGELIITYTNGSTGKSRADLCHCCFQR